MKFFKRLAIALAVLCVLLGVLCFFRAPLLRGAAHAWIVNQPLSKADAIVVLGGGVDTRPFEAARLYQMGWAPRILLMNPRPSPATQLGLVSSEAELSRNILLKKGVPATAIVVPSEVVTNSYDEALLLRKWSKSTRETKFIIVTDMFHTRRVDWLYHKELSETAIQVEFDAAPALAYTSETWFQNEQGVISFETEVVKYAFYRLKY
jgi:uncharacterized SAM-binding protein YcdF (DUF218 family)